MNSKSQLLKMVSILTVGLVLGGVAQVLAWDSAPASPPSCPSTISGCNTPLNASTFDQIKDGGLILNNDGGSTFGLIVNNAGKVSIGFNGLTASPAQASNVQLEVRGGAVKATNGLIIEARTDNPSNPEVGRMWLRTDL